VLALRPFQPADDESLISWVRSPDELLTFAGPQLSWPLDSAQLQRIRAAADTMSWTAVRPPSVAPIGHAELIVRRESPRRGHIARVIIDPARRRSGLGRELILAVLQVARAQKLEMVTLNVRKGNDGAIALYGGLGFRETHADHGADPAVLQMAMALGETR